MSLRGAGMTGLFYGEELRDLVELCVAGSCIRLVVGECGDLAFQFRDAVFVCAFRFHDAALMFADCRIGRLDFFRHCRLGLGNVVNDRELVSENATDSTQHWPDMRRIGNIPHRCFRLCETERLRFQFVGNDKPEEIELHVLHSLVNDGLGMR